MERTSLRLSLIVFHTELHSNWDLFQQYISVGDGISIEDEINNYELEGLFDEVDEGVQP